MNAQKYQSESFTETNRDRPLPNPPNFEDTFNEKNSSNQMIDRIFQSNKKDPIEIIVTQQTKLMVLMDKICERIDEMDIKMTKIQTDVEKIKQTQINSFSSTNLKTQPKIHDSAEKAEIKELYKVLGQRDECLMIKEKENKNLKEELKGAVMDKNILLGMINTLVENNSQNLALVEKEMKMSGYNS